MKKATAYLFLASLASCYSYKGAAAAGDREFGENKVYRLKSSGGYVKARNLHSDSLNYYYSSRSGEKSIPKSQVLNITERKFSVGKTVGLVLGIGGATAVLGSLVVFDGMRNFNCCTIDAPP